MESSSTTSKLSRKSTEPSTVTGPKGSRTAKQLKSYAEKLKDSKQDPEEKDLDVGKQFHYRTGVTCA